MSGDHEINLERALSPFGKRKYRAWCSCGRYQSRHFNFPGQAENAGADHVKGSR